MFALPMVEVWTQDSASCGYRILVWPVCGCKVWWRSFSGETALSEPCPDWRKVHGKNG